MRSQWVPTNMRCNQRCAYCTFRRAEDDPKAIAKDALLAHVEAELAAGVREIVFSGGEPTMRADLPLLLLRAKQLGATTTVLETNATLITPPMARAFAQAKLDRARVNLAMWSDELDRVTFDPGGFQRTRRGLHALREAAIPIELSVTLVRSTWQAATLLPARAVAELGDAVTRIVAVVPVSSPDETELLTHDEAARALLALDASCKREGVRLQLRETGGPPPCAFSSRSRPHHLYALSPGGASQPGFRRLEGCAACVLRDRCPGVAEAYLARHPEHRVTPIEDDRSRRRLSIIGSVEEQIAREVVQSSFATGGVAVVDEALIRVNFACNQACDFCFVSTHLPSAAERTIRRAIVDAASAGRPIVLTGGEPTLNPKLAEYVALARDSGSKGAGVEIQTNATMLDEAKVTALVAAGLTSAFVSLHGSDAATSDAITHAPGTFEKTLAGVDLLHRAGVRLSMNFVVCAPNASDITRTVELIAARWPGAAFNVSFVAPSSDLVPRDATLIPRYRDVLPFIDEAVARARELGVEVIGFGSMCGLPLCLVPPRVADFSQNPGLPEGADAGEFVRTSECEGCDLRDRCWGVRRGYAELHGTSELRRVSL